MKQCNAKARRGEVGKSDGKENRSVGKGSPGAGKVLNSFGRAKDSDVMEMQQVAMDLIRGAKELNCLERAMNRFAEDTLCIDTIRR